MSFRRPDFQTVCEIRHTRPWRIASAILAASCDATVVCRLSTGDLSAARGLGVRVLGRDEDPHDALVTTGLALLDASKAAPAPWYASPADCLVVEVTTPNRAMSPPSRVDTAPPRTLWMSERGCWRSDGSLARRLRTPAAPPRVERAAVELRRVFEGDDALLAERVAWEAASVLWLSGWLPRFADVLGWTRERLRRGVDLRVYR